MNANPSTAPTIARYLRMPYLPVLADEEQNIRRSGLFRWLVKL